MYVISSNLGSFHHYFFIQSLFPLLSLFSFSDDHNGYISLSTCMCVPQVPYALYFSSVSFLFLHQTQNFQITCPPVHWIFLLPIWGCCWTSLVNISTRLLYFSASKFLFGSFYHFYHFFIFILFSCHFYDFFGFLIHVFPLAPTAHVRTVLTSYLVTWMLVFIQGPFLDFCFF